MSINFEILLLVLILAFTAFILISTLRSKINKLKNQKILFTMILLTVIIWVISILVTDISFNNYSLSLWASRISFLSSCLIAISYYFFVKTFDKDFKIKFLDILFVILGTFFTVISLTEHILKSVTLIKENYLQSNFGSLYLGLSMFIASTFIYSCIRFYIIYRKEIEVIRRAQIFNILVGSTLSIVASLVTNILFPILGLPEIRALGPITLVFFLSFTYYAILRYRFLSINALVGKILYVILIGLFPLISFFVIYYFQLLIWGSIFKIEALISGFFISIFIVYLFLFTNKKLTEFINNKIINRDFNPELLKDTVFRKLSIQLDIKKISEIINIELNNALGSKNVSITVLDKTDKSIIYSEGQNLISEQTLNLLLNNYQKSELFIREELSYSNVKGFEVLYTTMVKEQIALFYVINTSLNNILIISVQEKITERQYTVEDIEIIISICSIIAVSIDRSILYTQVNEYAANLKIKIDEATEELQKKNNELTDSLRKERDMMDILGHELRTPLSIARNALATLEMLNRKDDYEIKKSELQGYLDKSLEAIRREIKILQTVLSSTRIENNRLQLTFSNIDCNDVINDAIEGLKSQANKKKLKLITDIPSKTIFCYADRDRTQEVIDNILDNAIKYTKEGTVTLKLEDQDSMVKFEIIDTGEGIPNEEIPNLGKKFHRVNMYGKEEKDGVQIVRPGGTGIGLYVVYNLVRMMNGRIEVKSDLGKGSTFFVYLPKSEGSN